MIRRINLDVYMFIIIMRSLFNHKPS